MQTTRQACRRAAEGNEDDRENVDEQLMGTNDQRLVQVRVDEAVVERAVLVAMQSCKLRQCAFALGAEP